MSVDLGQLSRGNAGMPVRCTGEARVPTNERDSVAVTVANVPPLVMFRGGRLHLHDVLVWLAFLAACLAYTDRVNISVAAIAMQQQFGWSQTEKGFVLSSFFIGYMVCLLPSGWLGTRFGGRPVLGVAVIVWSVCTLLTPGSASISMGALLATRIAMGAGESAVFPSGFAIVGSWVPAGERTRATARILSGIPVGQVAGLIVTGWILAHTTWPFAFYSFGAVGLLWAVVWFRATSREAMAVPRVEARGAAIADAGDAAPGPVPLPWRQLLASTPVLALVVGHFASNWTLYVLLAWLPSYFRDVLHLSIASAGVFAAGPWLAAAAVTNLAGPMSDRLIAGGVSVTATRKLMQCGGLVISAACLLGTRDVHSSAVALTLLCAATGALGLTWCGYAPGLIDVAPRHAALLGGFTNTVATIPGIVGVTVTGWLLDLTGTYSAAFILTAGVSLVSAMVFGLFFNARPLIE